MHTNQLGIYEANIKFISIETGLNNVEELLKSLYPKVVYIKEKKLIIIPNFLKYQNSGGSFERLLLNIFDELEEDIQILYFKISKEFREVLQKNNQELYQQLEEKAKLITEIKVEQPPVEGGLTGGRPGVDRGSMGGLTVSDTESESVSVSESETETEKINLYGEQVTANAGQKVQSESKKGNGEDTSKSSTKKKYPLEVKIFYEKFKTFREEYLKVPITHKDWHIRAYSVINKLLKKYSLQELTEALEDLKTPAWEDKATKILELWHFEDWLPRWKVWKQGKIIPKRQKTVEELIEEEVERVLRWAYPNLTDYEFKDNKRILLAYRKEHGKYPFNVPDEILKGGDKDGFPRGA
jgi:hypothetical protein